MRKINIGLVGLGTVGSGVLKFLKSKKSYFKNKYNVEFVVKRIVDRSIHKKSVQGFTSAKKSKNIKDILDDQDIEVVIELMGGKTVARNLVTRALKSKKHVITANKDLISNYGKELFQLARKNNTYLYFESSVGAGIPIINTITEGIVGNKFDSVYGIINGTCNFILTQMTYNNCSFEEALKEAQEKGYAESDPTLDINGMDSTHKLAILSYLAFGKFMKVKDIYTEGITHISHMDIENAEKLDLCIKLLAIAKKVDNEIEIRVHPTLISKDHPLASINSIYNAIYLHADPLGNILLSGEGAGQMAAASGVISDLVNYVANGTDGNLLANIYSEAAKLKLRPIDKIETKFYLRFMAQDKPGVLSKITGILGKQGISINSVTQKAHNQTSSVPVVMLTEYATEKKLRTALNQIQKLSIIKGKPVAIRMEKLW